MVGLVQGHRRSRSTELVSVTVLPRFRYLCSEVFSPGFAVHGRAREASLQVSAVSRPSAECLLAGACSEGPRWKSLTTRCRPGQRRLPQPSTGRGFLVRKPHSSIEERRGSASLNHLNVLAENTGRCYTCSLVCSASVRACHVSKRNSTTVTQALNERRACRSRAGLGAARPWPSPNSLCSSARL